ncbi:hypothetical protein [Curtobacterium sp. L1-20]|uniref:hypothetical protein n=1 Tax=Curtobacterium sp. L1-20 TaxID=3138181 RepID=UPI003B51EDC0
MIRAVRSLTAALAVLAVVVGVARWAVPGAGRLAGPWVTTLGVVLTVALLLRGVRALRRRARDPRAVRGLTALVLVTLVVWVLFAAAGQAVLLLPHDDVRQWVAIGLGGVLGVVVLLLALGVFAEWARIAEVIGEEERLEREALARRAAGRTVIVRGSQGTGAGRPERPGRRGGPA